MAMMLTATKIPVEIRVKIYKLLLLPPPTSRVECAVPALDGRYCTPGKRFLSSTCKLKPTTMRTFGCTGCIHRGGDVDTTIMRTNRQIFAEAAEVLYENVQVVHRFHGMPVTFDYWARDGMPRYASPHIKRLHLAVEAENMRPDNSGSQGPLLESYVDMCTFMLQASYSNVKMLCIHIDFDLIAWKQDQDFSCLKKLAKLGVEVVVDVHVLRAWKELETGWAEVVQSRDGGEGNDIAALEIDKWAKKTRERIIEIMSEDLVAEGKKLVVRES